MTAKLEKDDLDGLGFSAIRGLLGRICKSLGFKFSHKPFYSKLMWRLEFDDDDTVVFLDDHNRDEFQTAKDLLR